MAKPLTKLSTNFSFEKLKRNIKQLIKEEHTKYGKVLADNSVKNLVRSQDFKKQPLKKLSSTTLGQRRSGVHPEGKVQPTSSTKPLIYTGELEKSIKGIEGGYELKEYGWLHHNGVSTGDIERPERPFLAQTDDQDFQKLATRELIPQFVDAIHKKWIK